jgi:hypothetical protein
MPFVIGVIATSVSRPACHHCENHRKTHARNVNTEHQAIGLPSRAPSTRPFGERAAARGRDVKRALAGKRRSRPRAVVCSACPGRRCPGWLAAPPSTRVAHGSWPSRRRSAPAGGISPADRDPRYGAAWPPRRAPARPPAGCRPTLIGCPRCCPFFGGPEGFSLFAPADGRWPGRPEPS